MFRDADDVIEILTISLTTSASALSQEGLESAVASAMSELGWSYPVEDPNRIMWISKRALRHACFILWVASAQKFKYKQVNLQQRFEHYEKLIKHMDTEYEDALSSSVNIFSNVERYKMFGTAVGAGFRYDFIGRDLTYDDLIPLINTGE